MPIIRVDPEEWLLTISRWQREALDRAMSRLVAPEAGEEIEDEPDTVLLPMIPDSDLPPATERYEAMVEEEANDRAAGREWLA